MSKPNVDPALVAALMAAMGLSPAAPLAASAAPAWMAPTTKAKAKPITATSTATKTEKAPKAFGGRTWNRLPDAPSSYPGYPASAVFVSSSQPNKPRYIPLDLVEAILSSK